MNSSAIARQQLIEVINRLPSEVLPELANYLDYLKFKTTSSSVPKSETTSGNSFLLSIAGLGEAEENLSECDEDILQQEIDPIRGWGFDREEKQ